MLLGEALIERKNNRQRISELGTRINSAVTVQEGDEPLEDVKALYDEAMEACSAVAHLTERINRSNLRAKLSNGMTITEAISEIDGLKMKKSFVDNAVNAASYSRGNRYSRSEIKTTVVIDVPAYRKDGDTFAKSERELDGLIQAVNWTVELVD